jgi:hypothetical protein
LGANFTHRDEIKNWRLSEFLTFSYISSLFSAIFTSFLIRHITFFEKTFRFKIDHSPVSLATLLKIITLDPDRIAQDGVVGREEPSQGHEEADGRQDPAAHRRLEGGQGPIL